MIIQITRIIRTIAGFIKENFALVVFFVSLFLMMYIFRDCDNPLLKWFCFK